MQRGDWSTLAIRANRVADWPDVSGSPADAPPDERRTPMKSAPTARLTTTATIQRGRSRFVVMHILIACSPEAGLTLDDEGLDHRPAIVAQIRIEPLQPLAPARSDVRCDVIDQCPFVRVVKIPARFGAGMDGKKGGEGQSRVGARGRVAWLAQEGGLKLDIGARAEPRNMSCDQRIKIKGA